MLFILAGFLALLPAAWAPAVQAANSGVVIMYHRFGEDAYPTTSVTVEQLDEHIRELQSGSYAVMPLAEMIAALRAGRPLPDRAVAITIDDAYRSVYDVAWPKFRDAGLPFTVFVSTAGVDTGAPGIMTWDHLREMHQGGAAIEAHTVSHLHMADADVAKLREEVTESTLRIASEIGSKPKFFAYPYGEASDEVKAVVSEAGYTVAFGQQSGPLYPEADMLYLPRFPINMSFGGPDRFRQVINTLPLSLTDVLPSNPTLTKNPPNFGFTLPAKKSEADGIACYHSSFGRLTELEKLGESRIEIRFTEPFPEGRSRINCTAPGPNGRWRWFGMQYYVPAR
ncbi:polysaccharide deacetylase family protein [Hwanghaeella grinnelliae]|nr:polysaccharide deacetylase family protein [Hwanghaeella grinnelliae]